MANGDNSKPSNNEEPLVAASAVDSNSPTTSNNTSRWQFPKIAFPDTSMIQSTIDDIYKLPQRWKDMKVPEHMEQHLENGLIKAVFGAAVGGTMGLILFRSGSGWRSACMAVGVGAAVGNTYQRIGSPAGATTSWGMIRGSDTQQQQPPNVSRK